MQIRKNLGIRGFQKTQVGSKDREFCGDGLEPHRDRRSRWVLLVDIKKVPFFCRKRCKIEISAATVSRTHCSPSLGQPPASHTSVTGQYGGHPRIVEEQPGERCSCSVLCHY